MSFYLLICIFMDLPLDCIGYSRHTRNAIEVGGNGEDIWSTVVMIGPKGSGKSTTAGYLRWATSAAGDAHHYIHEVDDEDNFKGVPNVEFSGMWRRMEHIDGDIGIFQIEYPIDNIKTAFISMIDYPFHNEYAKNALAFYSQADCAVLVVSAQKDEFKQGSLNYEQTQTQLFTISAMGIQNLIVVVNKMDTTEPRYSEARFNEVANLVKTLIKRVGLFPKYVPFIPISAVYEDNLILRSSRNMDWWTMQSITSPTRTDKLKFESLYDAIKSSATNGKRTLYNDLKALRIPILDVYHEGGVGTIAIGRVQNGYIKTGATVKFAPSGLTSEVKELQVKGLQVDNSLDHKDSVGGGEIAQILFPWNVTVDAIKKGDVCYNANEDPAMETESFIARINVIDHPGQIVAGYTAMMHIHTAAVACRFDKLISKTNMRTRKTEKNPNFLVSGDRAEVQMIPDPVYVSPIRVYHRLSGFVIRDGDKTVAVGGVMSTVP